MCVVPVCFHADSFPPGTGGSPVALSPPGAVCGAAPGRDCHSPRADPTTAAAVEHNGTLLFTRGKRFPCFQEEHFRSHLTLLRTFKKRKLVWHADNFSNLPSYLAPSLRQGKGI